ncbi:MAG: hypothetical protein AB1589_28850 [Cyanobacteriota bacterium]
MRSSLSLSGAKSCRTIGSNSVSVISGSVRTLVTRTCSRLDPYFMPPSVRQTGGKFAIALMPKYSQSQFTRSLPQNKF